MTRNLLLLLFLLGILSCHPPASKPGQEKDFYNTISGWDIKHVPVIPPFRASSTYPGHWLLNGSKEFLHLGKNRAGDIPVHSFGVSKNYIYGKTENGQWFLFNIYSLLYAEYTTEDELTETLKKYKLDKNDIELCDDYFKQLSANKRCYWYPKAGGEYPMFKDYQPDSSYTVFVEGADRVKDFKVKGKVKKTNSKIYYFKMNCGNDKNDLLYVSFDYSYPRLIKNDEIIAAYAEDNSLLNIAVYTPFPVAKSRGIEEKDRVIISREVVLE